MLQKLGDSTLVTSRWLREHGYAGSLVARYVSSGWLTSPVRGIYQRTGGVLRWAAVMNTLHLLEALPLYVGARFALAWQGHEHFPRLGVPATVTLYGAAKPPGCVGNLALPERFDYRGSGPFEVSGHAFSKTPDKTLQAHGLKRLTVDSATKPVVMAMPERAILELCDEPPGASFVYEVDAIMQGLITLRPNLLT